MNKRYLLAAMTLFFSAAAFSQVPLYTSGFDNTAGQTGWTQYRTGAAEPFYEWDFQNSQAFSPATCIVHNYPVGGTNATDDWFVSPAFAIPNGGTLDSLRYAFTGFGVPTNSDTVALYLLAGSGDPELSAMTLIHTFSGANYQNDNTWRLLAPIALPAQSGSSHIGIRYKTVNNWLDVRFDNVAVSGNSGVGISENPTQELRLFPNPATESVRIATGQQWPATEKTELALFDAAGKQVLAATVSAGQEIPVPFAAGLYTYVLTGKGMPPVAGKLAIR